MGEPRIEERHKIDRWRNNRAEKAPNARCGRLGFRGGECLPRIISVAIFSSAGERADLTRISIPNMLRYLSNIGQIDMSENFVCFINELPDGTVRIFKRDALEIGVIRNGEDYFAYRNLCPHQGGPACEGLRLPQVEDVVDAGGFFLGQRFNQADMHIVCPWHGYEFHLATGEHVCDARLRLHKYDVATRDGGIYVDV